MSHFSLFLQKCKSYASQIYLQLKQCKKKGHEITHILEGTEHYSALQEAVKKYAESKGEYDSRLQSIAKLYENIEGTNVENELTADLIGDYLFTDAKFIESLCSDNPRLFKKLWNEIKYLCKTVTAGSKEAKQLLKVKRAFEKAYQAKNEQKNNTDTNDGVNSTNIKFSLDFDKYPYNMQTVIKEYIESVDKKLLNMIEESKSKDKAAFKRYTIGNVTQKLKDDIMNRLKIDVTDYVNAINSNAIQHIIIRHGENGKADNSMSNSNDIARMGYIVENYDSFEVLTDENGNIEYSEEFRNADNTKAPMIRLSKKINGTYYVVEAVPEGKYKKIWVVSAYISKGSAVTQAPNNSGSYLASPSSANNNISQSDNTVNNNSTQDDTKYSLSEENSHKQEQLNIINESNPAPNTYLTWIRDTKDIMTFEQALNDEEYADYDEFNPDFTRAMAENALNNGEITVYSSYPIENGAFVTPSRMEAESYSGSGQVYEKTVDVNDVAWIDITQGQYAKVENKYSLSEQYIAPVKKNGNYNVYGEDIALGGLKQNNITAPIGENVKRTAKSIALAADNVVAPVREDIKKNENLGPVRELSVKEQLKANNNNTLNEMNTVAIVDEEKIFTSKQDVAEWALEKFEKTDFKVNREGFGEIIIDKRRVKKGLSYLKTNEERLALAAVPQVLSDGIQIGGHTLHKGRPYNTLTFAAPVEINGQRGNLAVVVRQEGKNYYKVHRLVMPDGRQFTLYKDKEDIAETVGGAENGSGLSPTDNIFTDSIAQKTENGQENFEKRDKELTEGEKIEREALEKFDRKAKEEKEALRKEFQERAKALEAETYDQNVFIKKKARALYEEFPLKKGVRVSKELGFICTELY